MELQGCYCVLVFVGKLFDPVTGIDQSCPSLPVALSWAVSALHSQLLLLLLLLAMHALLGFLFERETALHSKVPQL